MRNSSRIYKITIMDDSSSDDFPNENEIILSNSGEDQINTFEEILERVSIPGSSHDLILEDSFDFSTLFEMSEKIKKEKQEEIETEELSYFDPKFMEQKASILIVPFFPKIPEEVQNNRVGLYEWNFSYEAQWSEAMIDAYHHAAFTHSFENKQLRFFDIGRSDLIQTSQLTQPYREKSLVFLSEKIAFEISQKWKRLPPASFIFNLYKEKNAITQKVVFMIDFCSKKMKRCIPYLKGVINVSVSPDKSTIKHDIAISTWLNFQNEATGWMKTPDVIYQRTIANCFYYGLNHFFELFFTKSNEIFEK